MTLDEEKIEALTRRGALYRLSDMKRGDARDVVELSIMNVRQYYSTGSSFVPRDDIRVQRYLEALIEVRDERSDRRLVWDSTHQRLVDIDASITTTRWPWAESCD